MQLLLIAQSPILNTGISKILREEVKLWKKLFGDLLQITQIGLYSDKKLELHNWIVLPADSFKHKSTNYHKYHGEAAFDYLIKHNYYDFILGFNDPQELMYLCKTTLPKTTKLILYTYFDGTLPFNGFEYLKSAHKVIFLTSYSEKEFKRTHSPVTNTKVILPQVLKLYLKKAVKNSRVKKLKDKNIVTLGWVGNNQWRKQIWINYYLLHLLKYNFYLQCTSCGHALILDTFIYEQILLSHSNNIIWTDPKYGKPCLVCNQGTIIQAYNKTKFKLLLHFDPNSTLNTWSVHDLHLLYKLEENHDLYYTKKDDLNDSEMLRLFNNIDIMLYLTGGEGFGLPFIEAASQLEYIVYTNYSAHSDLSKIMQKGSPVGGTFQPEAPNCIDRCIANVESVLNTLLQITKSLKNTERSKGCAPFADINTISWETIENEWSDIFQ